MNESTVLANLVWVLPRPRIPYYKGGFPLHFEKRLWRLLGKPDPKLILHPFGGMAEIGIRCDLLPEVKPDKVADAHELPFPNESFQVVICDPPYSDEENLKLYGIKRPLEYNKWVNEAVRVCKRNGFVVLYSSKWCPRPKGCSFWVRIIILLKSHHSARICSIFQKDGEG